MFQVARIAANRSRCFSRPASSALHRILVGAVALLCCTAPVAFAAPLQHVYDFETSLLRRSETSLGVQYEAGAMQRTWFAGQPELPFDTVTLLVPQGSSIARVNAVPEDIVVLEEGVRLAIAGSRFTVEGHEVSPSELPQAHKAQAGFPALYAEAMGTAALHGYQLVHVRVFPVRYEADTGRVTVATRIALDIELESGGDLPTQLLRPNARIENAARRQVASLIENPQALDLYAPSTLRKSSVQPRGFQPTDAPSLEGSPVDYVIITSAALEASMQALADWKTLRGVPTVVRTLEWIEANYRHGSDRQETIRTFIKDAYTKWAVSFVLLAGDTDVVPARYGYSGFGPETEEDIPTDMYYACLDGNWNLDGDDLWGEAAISALDPGDNADFYAEIYLGRLPISTPQEASNLINKIMTYEDPTDNAYQAKTLFLGEVLFPVDWDGLEPISMDGAIFSEDMRSRIDTLQTLSTRLYENTTQFPAAAPLTLNDAIVQLNSGVGFVNHIGHGYRYSMSCGDFSLVNDNALSLTNGDTPFVLYMLNCTATAFDFPCLAEAYLDNTNGGAVAVLGSSRAAFALPSRNYNLGFFEAVHENGVTQIGEAFTESRLGYTPNAWFDTADHYTHLLYNMLADPELVIHTTALGTTAATHVSSVGLGKTTITVTVTVDGAPRADALVCLMKDTEEYVVGRTDGAGNVSLDFVAESAGNIQLTVSGQNMMLHQDIILVDDGAGPYVHVTGLALDDDDSGTTAGNGDGFIDAGETVTFGATLSNTGTGTANNLTGVLRCDSPWVTIMDSTYTSGSINQGASSAASGTPGFEVASNTPDGTVLALEWVTTNGIDTWTDGINRVVRAPKLELTLMEIDDSSLGNGDGIIQAGESFEVLAYFKNYGTGSATDINLTLLSGDADLIVSAGASSITSLLPLQESAGATAFQVTENVIDENNMTLLVSDRWGNGGGYPLTLRGPGVPGTPVPDATQGNGIIAVSWDQSVEPDIVGYHLYRSTDPGGPWTRVTQDRTQGVAYYSDTGLAPSTEYFYYVTAVDNSGNESQPSALANINTSPAQLSGWPIVMGNVSSCPAVAGDVTGDGQKELIAGNDHLYAWTWGGIELRDDDNDPQTWGVFASEINTITAAMLLAELDPAPGLEIFATTWDDSNKTYVVDGSGNFLPGWPQSPNPTSAPAGYWGSPGAADVDGDGYAEVFAPGKNGNLYAWNGDGSPVGASVAFKSGLGVWSRCSPTFGNVDGDPFPEIIYGAPNGTLHIWNADGTYAPNFPVSTGTLLLSSTALGDVNNDGILDVVVMSENDSLACYDTSSGDMLPGWPVYLNSKANPIAPSPALADFDFDGYLEIVVANNHVTVGLSAVHVFDYQGNLLPGWPKSVDSHHSESSPIVADFSGDGVPDVLFGNESGFIFGWDKDGNELIGFPLTIGDFIRSTPFADDIDGDGDIDLLLAGWDQNLWVWDFTAPWDPAAAHWPTFKHDGQRTGNFGFRPNGTVSDTDPPGDEIDAPVPRKAFLGQNVPNPFNPLTRISYGVPASSWVRIEIFDVRGRSVRKLVDGTQAAGTYEAIWDGRDGRGRRVDSGVFFYRLQVGDTRLQRKMVLLK